jgi:16S rRNA A1518/A1519 N6-dimethyltransferase RsmA/KsgA/DIM1 with predicted DNA glycosylase/AP lyase activity
MCPKYPFRYSWQTQAQNIYKRLDVRNRVVIDVGADNGTTVNLFLSRGARRVIAFEADPNLLKQLQENFADDLRVEAHGAWYGVLVEGDVLKMDCEGCETNVSDVHLWYYPQWVVGVHHGKVPNTKIVSLVTMIERNGGVLALKEFGEDVYYKGLKE